MPEVDYSSRIRQITSVIESAHKAADEAKVASARIIQGATRAFLDSHHNRDLLGDVELIDTNNGLRYADLVLDTKTVELVKLVNQAPEDPLGSPQQPVFKREVLTPENNPDAWLMLGESLPTRIHAQAIRVAIVAAQSEAKLFFN